MQRVHANAPSDVGIVHVMDREADDFALWACVLDQGADFVIRAKHNRRAKAPSDRLDDALADQPLTLTRTVPLRARGKKRPPASKKRHPPRQERTATLQARTGPCEIRRPRGASTVGEETVVLNVVEVIEVGAPDGAAPVSWRLLTTLPTTTPEALARVIDIYRKRWLIEEFFKALKTGCAAEKRQARSWDSMVRTLTLLTPIAWRLLVLQAMSRTDVKALWSPVIDEVELEVLSAERPEFRLSTRSTARSILLAVASLGGHLKSNGEPGWQVLGRGLEKLLTLSAGYRIAAERYAKRRELEM